LLAARNQKCSSSRETKELNQQQQQLFHCELLALLARTFFQYTSLLFPFFYFPLSAQRTTDFNLAARHRRLPQNQTKEMRCEGLLAASTLDTRKCKLYNAMHSGVHRQRGATMG
jgi:hypothetical protein